MKKKHLLLPALSSLLLSTAILSQTTYATEVEPVVDTTEQALTTTAVEETPAETTEAATAEETAVAEEAAVTTTASTEEVATTADTVVAEETLADDTITILHTNDMHGRIEEGSGVIGMAKLATVVEEERAQGTTIVLDAGDPFQGMPISNSTKGEDMAALMNAVGYDAMAVGNHEFDFGFDQAMKYKEILNFPILSANTYINGVRAFEAYTEIDKTPEVAGDEIIVIGVTTPETSTKTHPNNVVGVTFKDPVTEVNTVISEVEAKGRANGRTYNTYIILGHLGVDPTTNLDDQGSFMAEQMAKNPELEGKTVIVIDGHSHTVLSATYGDPEKGETLVTYNQTGSYLNNIGKITLNSEKVLSAGVIAAEEAKAKEANPEIAAKVAEIAEKFAQANAVVIRDNNPVELNGDRMNVRVRETNLGNAVTDALYNYAQTGFAHKADLAVTNGGGLRDTIKADQPITVGDTIAVLPFGNIISQIEVTGQQIEEMYKFALSASLQTDADGNPVLDDNGNPLLGANGGFLHTSGARVFYDTNLEPENRVISIEILNKETGEYDALDLAKTYYLATNDFVAAGGDGYTMLGGAREEGVSMDEVFAEYLKTADLSQYAEVNPNSRLISIDSSRVNDTITILHTNDMHGRIEEASGVIGAAKLATVVENARKEGTTIVLDAGDPFQGMPISNSSNGEDFAAIMNEIGYDAMAVGNHEFDFGFDQAVKYQEILNFPLLSANTYYVDGARVFQASTIIDKTPGVDGDEVVVIGVTTPETYTKTHPDNVKNIVFTDPLTEVNNVISEIEAKAKAEGKEYNTYVILGHLGIDPTTKTEWQGSYIAEELSKNPELEGKKVIVIDGHSHTLASATYGNVTYNQTGSYLNNIGKVTLNSEKVLSAGVITADEAKALDANEAIATKVQEIADKFAEANAVVIVENNPVELNGDRMNVRVRETNLGNAVNDALYAYAQTGFSHKADLAVTNGGNIRTTLAKDEPITVGDVIAVLPFGNIISQIEVTGQQILEMYQFSFSGALQTDENGDPVLDENGNQLLGANAGLLHTTGARVYYDTKLDPENRVVKIEILDHETGEYLDLDLEKTYYLATNDFIAAGGDGYTMLGGAREEGVSLDEVFAEWLKTADLTQYEEINPATRLILIDSSKIEEEQETGLFGSATADLQIVHTNDMHGRIEEGSGVIGAAKLASVVDEIRKNGTTIVLDAGDPFQGLPISNTSKGEDFAEIMNAIGYDAMAVGNHEFDFGLDQVEKFKEILNFPLLSANVYVNGARLFQASTIIDKDETVEGDEWVVIGVTTPETATKTHPNNIPGVTFEDPITEVKAVIREIEAKAKADGKEYKNYIVLGHLGVDNTTPTEWLGTTMADALAGMEELAGKRVIFIDGHSHTVLSGDHDGVTYNQTGSYLNNIGLITLESEKVLAGVISAQEVVDSGIEGRADVAEMVAAAKARHEKESSIVVLENNPVHLSGDRADVRVRETNLGNVVADALWEYGQTGFSSPSNLALTNGGGLRETLAKDQPITKGDIIAVLPFGNTITQITVTGQQIKEMFDHSLGSINQVDADGNVVLDENGNPIMEPAGHRGQISGARVYYDTNLDPENRVLYIEIYDHETDSYLPLDLEKEYKLVTNDFIAAGGDGYTMLGGAREEGPSMDVAFANYLATADLTQYAEINPNSRSISVDSTKDTDGDGHADYIEVIYGTDWENAADFPGKEEVVPQEEEYYVIPGYAPEEDEKPEYVFNPEDFKDVLETEKPTEETKPAGGAAAAPGLVATSTSRGTGAATAEQPARLSRVEKHSLPNTGDATSILGFLGTGLLGLAGAFRRRKED